MEMGLGRQLSQGQEMGWGFGETVLETPRRRAAGDAALDFRVGRSSAPLLVFRREV